MKGTWSSRRKGNKKDRLSGAKKRSADGEEINTLVALDVAEATNKKINMSKETQSKS